ncbi:DUF7553 family protein [Halobacterium jilantaiense]|uniref:Uncharacterized protein n=1 Tax=Halobacterium jilantaiense TaxID=355548 RepID=A0A1I0PPH0_9EURY|nr:hypothetical protein [Halobacterium jilantaiense]SEW16276.1 hypothetical protein SAMN04487945_1846 [Halobacterium jilantaiense]
MPSDYLATAAELLDDAAEDAAGDASDRLREQADAVAALAARDRGPDHGRLARIEHVLTDVSEGLGDDDAAADAVDRALAELREYRSGVDGV